MLNDPAATTGHIDSEAAVLAQAVIRFNSLVITPSTGDLNSKDGFDIGDLGIIAYLYNKSEGQPEWKEQYDLNGDGTIGLYEVQFIANRILNK
ncbi:Hyaluronoglucosaminidase precursor [compost metagenome]